eukprot:8544914-Pyramimonas_sp.AAC.1
MTALPEPGRRGALPSGTSCRRPRPAARKRKVDRERQAELSRRRVAARAAAAGGGPLRQAATSAQQGGPQARGGSPPAPA